jgi:hypothetical protein
MDYQEIDGIECCTGKCELSPLPPLYPELPCVCVRVICGPNCDSFLHLNIHTGDYSRCQANG